MFQIVKWIYQILLDERGEDAPAAGGEGLGGVPAESGEGSAPGAGEGLGGEGGQGGEPPAAPAFGDFGDAPKTLEEATALLQKVYGEHTKLKPEYETLKGKTAATERNLALTRKALEGSGIRAVQDEDGNIRLEVVNQQPKEKKMRFQDTHKALFDEKILEAMRYLIQDEFDNTFESRQKESQETYRRQQIFSRMRNQAVNLMFAYFPQLDGKFDDDGNPTSPTFDAKLHQRAEEIWKEKYPNNPQGELMGALEAARELGIPAQAIAQAKKEGFQAGKTDKKILGPVGQGGGAGAAKGGKLSKEEYLKLSPEQKVEHDKNQLGVT